MVVRAGLQPRPCECLVLCQAGEYTKHYRHPRVSEIELHDGLQCTLTQVSECWKVLHSSTVEQPLAHDRVDSHLHHDSLTWLTASDMYSKCIVSPLIRQPMHITASIFPLSIKHRAPNGSSKEPGTCIGTINQSVCRLLAELAKVAFESESDVSQQSKKLSAKWFQLACMMVMSLRSTPSLNSSSVDAVTSASIIETFQAVRTMPTRFPTPETEVSKLKPLTTECPDIAMKWRSKGVLLNLEVPVRALVHVTDRNSSWIHASCASGP